MGHITIALYFRKIPRSGVVKKFKGGRSKLESLIIEYIEDWLSCCCTTIQSYTM